jgi:CheY-like chemotaxis protein
MRAWKLPVRRRTLAAFVIFFNEAAIIRELRLVRQPNQNILEKEHLAVILQLSNRNKNMGHFNSKRGRETILVVEDAEAIRTMVCAMLTQQGYRCLTATDGADALEMLRDQAVHLVLTDLIMPRMTGAELAGHLARRQPDVRIIFMSGYSDDPVVQQVGRVSPIFLHKPFTTDTLVTKIREALDRPWSGLPDTATGAPSQ